MKCSSSDVLHKMAAIVLDVLSENSAFITLIVLAERAELCLALALELLPLNSILKKLGYLSFPY